ncbi:hypothetical protein J4Q44_G00067270 [Coregonus suidteri]|uniref:Eukaryotic translation initiation factor 4E binding protein 1 n=1 Tax=Coregonus suidteri TaxID=861788 RepID=A0AAN8QZ70_9TELE
MLIERLVSAALQSDARRHPVLHTTPGGTRIIYDRKVLLECRNSPIARTPPCCLPHIPGVTVPALHPLGKLKEMEENKDFSADDAQFVIDI